MDETGKVATFWHRYTERQKEVLRELCRLLCRHYPIRAVVGHSDITERKQDPGPELGLGDVEIWKFEDGMIPGF